MGQFELNDGLRQHLVKPGDPGRNPLGFNGQDTRRRNRELERLARAELGEPCPYPGFEHLTCHQYVVKVWVRQAMEGNEKSRKELHDRLYGKVPLQLNVEQQQQEAAIELSALPDEKLADLAIEAALAVKAEIAARRAQRAIEAVPVDHTELGSGLPGVEPTGPANDGK